MTARFTAAEIADLIAEADGCALEDHPAILNRTRHLARRGILRDGQPVPGDLRNTQNFPVLEAYRARLFDALAPYGFEHATLAQISAAGDRHPAAGDPVAPSMKVGEALHSQGGFRDALRGVAAGESWTLEVESYARKPLEQSGFKTSDDLRISFLWRGGFPVHKSATRPQVRLSLDLEAVFGPLIETIGLPS